MPFKTEEEALEAFRETILIEGLINFDGQNCEEIGQFCGGWDGESRRCSCGNRRVSLTTAQDKSGLWHWYAEAY